MRYIFWDFDGTLAYREGGMWGASLMEVLEQTLPGHGVDAAQISPHLRSGFPWHTPETAHTHIRSADEWWNQLAPVFIRAYEEAGIDRRDALRLAASVRAVYTHPSKWRLFDDTLPVLRTLSESGWKHALLTNHVPELREIIESLGILPYFHAISNSAETGYEKPHPESFGALLRNIDAPARVFMIGDSFAADVCGAESAGIPAILVRRPHPQAQRYCESLLDVVPMIG